MTALPNWAKYAIVAVPIVGAALFLAWWFLLRDAHACPEGFTHDAVLNECVPEPPAGTTPGPGPEPGPDPQPRPGPSETINFDIDHSAVMPQRVGVGAQYLIVGFEARVGVYPRVQTLSGVWNCTILGVEEGARFGISDKSPHVVLIGLRDDDTRVKIADVPLQNVEYVNEDVTVAGAPGIRLKQVTMEVTDDYPEQFGENVEFTPFNIRRTWPYPRRAAGQCIVNYGA
jgi:hypothetical protein